MHGDEIGVGQSLLAGTGQGDLGRQVMDVVQGWKRVKAQHPHAMMQAGIGDADPDLAEAENRQGLAGHLLTLEFLLAGLDLTVDLLVFLPGKPLTELDTLLDIAQPDAERGVDQFDHGIGVGAGGIEDADSFFRGLVHGNIIDTGPSTGHRQQFGKGGQIDLGTAHHNAFGMGLIGTDSEPLVKQIQPFFGNGVDRFDFELLHAYPLELLKTKRN